MPTSTTISLVRHGHVHNPEKVVYGRLPGFGLSEAGQQQAGAAAFCSPQLRARQTAEIILAAHPALTPTVSPWLDEVHTPYDGYDLSEMVARNWDIYSGVGPEYEQPADLVARLRQFLNHVRREYPGQHVLAVSHGDPIAFLILWAKGMPLQADQKETLTRLGLSDNYPQPASITTVTFQTVAADERPSLDYVKPY
jgi:broad specificity phosphatase PhoE